MTTDATAPGLGSDPARTERQGAVHLLRELTMPGVLALVAIYLIVGLVTMQAPSNADFPGPRFFPGIITAALIVLVAVQAVAGVRAWRRGTLVELGEDEDVRRQSGLSMEAGTRSRLDVRALAWILGGFLGFSFLLDLLGWVIGGALLFWCVARAFGSRRVLLDLVIGLTLASAAYIGFDMMLGLSLPSGILGGGF